jgi:predicted amidohydrolase
MIYQIRRVVAKRRTAVDNGGSPFRPRKERIMATWRIACVQMDCHLGEKVRNLDTVRTKLREAAGQQAQLVAFPECALTGYSFTSKAEALPYAESIPGPATEAVAADCRRLGVWAVFGLLELDISSGDLYNACALVGPRGQVYGYRKIHLPCLGIDRFATPGDRPFAVHDLGGLRVGINICYDGSFPEASRILALLGADLLLLPTNWPVGASACALVPARALENHVFYAAINRVGDERGFHFQGRSRVADCSGEFLAASAGDEEEILYAAIDPEVARAKRVVKIPGEYEVDRINDRRPEMYGLICEIRGKK